MKKFFPLFLLAISNIASAQITITDSDLPKVGDTLRYSQADPLSFTADMSKTGANQTWNFSGVLKSESQMLDEYKTTAQVDLVYAAAISPNAYGYKVADSFPGYLPLPISLPISLTDIYIFFGKKASPPRYVAEGFGAKVNGFGVPAAYTDEDEHYFLPLAYGNYDSSTYHLKVQLPTFGSLGQKGTRKTWVDGWGTIETPYFTSPAKCIRVRTMIDEIDSIQISSFPAIGLPRVAIDYKWLVEGEHYPALWVSVTAVLGQEMVTAVRYKDKYIPTSIQTARPSEITKLEAYPNPAAETVTLTIPATAKQYVVEVFDVHGKLVATQQNNNKVALVSLPAGNYIARVTMEGQIGYAAFAKQ